MLKVLELKDSCTACGACVSVCPKDALTLRYNSEGFYYPQVDRKLCIGHHLCEQVCHVITNESSQPSDVAQYMVKSNSEELVRLSSSGGVFSILAESVLGQGGVVYGARYNYKLERAEHASTDECDLSELRKAKYVESYLGDTFVGVSRNLSSGRKVLFCGTPCQVRGLKRYLEFKKVDVQELLLVQFICHGVPSNENFTHYKHFVEKRCGSKHKTVDLDFRSKTYGWSRNSIKFKFSNGRTRSVRATESLFLLAFRDNIALRRSCYGCDLLREGNADITLGDFWGVLKYRPELNDEKGISLVLLHGDKAQRIFDSLKGNFWSEELPASSIEYIYGDNKQALKAQRDKRAEEIQRCGYVPYLKSVYTKYIIKRVIKRVIFGAAK